MTEKKLTWHKIAEHENELTFNAGNLLQMEIAGKQVCLSKYGERILAFAAKCPHAGGSLVNGHVDALGNVVCPLHRYKFSIYNGRNTSGEGYFLKRFPLQINSDGIFISFEENKSFL